MRCPKCGSDYHDQLACPVCARKSSLQALSERMASSIKEGSKLHYTRTGHLTLGPQSWRAIWRDWGGRPNRATDIPTLCGVPHIYGQISEITTASTVSSAADMLGEQFHPCAKCASGVGGGRL